MEKASRGYGQGLWWALRDKRRRWSGADDRREEIYSGVDEWRTVRIGGACAISIAQAVCVSASVVCEMSESAETRRILLKRKISVSSGHKAKRTAETRIVQTDGSRATPRVLQPRSLASASEHLAHLVGNEPF